MVIERANEADAADLLQLQKLAYQSEAELYHNYSIEPLTQTTEDIRSAIRSKTVLKAVEGSRIIGSVRAQSDGQTCSIGKLFVHPEFQNKGVGTKLMTAVENECAGVSRYRLFTGHQSLRNLHLYDKLGYRKTGEKQISGNLSIVFLEKQT